MNLSRYTLIGLLPAAGAQPIVIEKDQDVNDIMDLISFAHKRNAAAYDKIAGEFWAGNIYDTCEKLWNFCKDKIFYDVEGEDIQSICSPRRILQKGRGDCKHFATFINGILSSLNRQGYAKINNVYRFASYRILNSIPTHVFAVVKTSEGEIWIDPVMDYFNQHHPYTYAVDRKIKDQPAATMSGVELDYGEIGCCGDTGRSLGIAPVVIYAAVELVGLAIKAFGNNYSVQSSVRWLIQLYQQYVLGQTGITATNANQQLANTSIQWFSNQLGVPVLDRTMFDLLKGYADPADQGLHRQTYEQRAANYKQHTSTENVTTEQAINAAKLADQYLYAMPPGSWRNIPTAAAIDAAGGAIPAPGAALSAGISPLILLAGGGLLLSMILKPGPKKRIRH
jgi:hypothetical protein